MKYDKPTTIGGRVRLARLEAKMTVADLARKTGLARTTIYDLERGDSKSTTRLPAIANATKTNPVWLETGLGVKLSRGSHTGGESNVRNPRPPTAWAPVVSFAQAGDWAEVVDSYEPGDAEHWFPIPPGLKCSASSFWTELTGRSMINTTGGNSYPPGSFVLIDPEKRDAVTGALILARLNETHEATFKRLNVEGTKYYLEPLNTQYEVIEISGDAQIIGTMVSALIMP